MIDYNKVSYRRYKEECDLLDALLYGYAVHETALSKMLYDQYSRLIPDITKVIFNDPATIIFWDDGTKTVVKTNGESFDPEKGLIMAIAKKAFGNKGNYYNVIKKWLPKGDTDESFKSCKEHYQYENIILSDRKQARDILHALRGVVERCGLATVLDLYNITGIVGNYEDSVHGWTDLDDAYVMGVVGGYSVKLPEPEHL